MERLIAPEDFWIQLRAGVSVVVASRAAGVSPQTAYRWLAEAGGPSVFGRPRGLGCPWGGRMSEEVREAFGARLRRGLTVPAAARAVGVSKATGYAWLAEASGVQPRVQDPDLEGAVVRAVACCRSSTAAGSRSWSGLLPAIAIAVCRRHRSTITRELARGRPAAPVFTGRWRSGVVDQNRRLADLLAKPAPAAGYSLRS